MTDEQKTLLLALLIICITVIFTSITWSHYLLQKNRLENGYVEQLVPSQYTTRWVHVNSNDLVLVLNPEK